MRAALEAKKKIVEPDLPVGRKPVAHSGEVDGAVVFVDLDGVSSAKRDVRTALSGEMAEDALPADDAAGARLAGGDFGALTRPQIEGQ